MLRSALEYKEGRARQDLNLLFIDVQVGEGASEFPGDTLKTHQP